MKMRTVLSVMVAAALLVASCKEKAADWQPATPEEVCQHIGFAWNLGNHFDSRGFARNVTPETARYWDGVTPTEQLYRNLAANGVRTVRIPVTWGPWESDAPEYTIDPAYIALVRQNVEWARDNGLNVIINLHHDEYWLDIYSATYSDSVNQSIMQRIERTWAQVADAFRDEGNYLYMETFNEVHAKTPQFEDWSGQWARSEEKSLEIMNQWNSLAVKTIRATGGRNATRWIVLNGYAGNPYLTMDYLTMPADEAGRIMLSVHTYSPTDFTLEDSRETWGVGESRDRDEQELRSLFQRLGQKYTSQGIPVYLGEFGCDAHATEQGEECRLRYLSLIAEEARKVSIPVVIWDNGNRGAGAEHHAYFDHADGSVVEGAENIIKTMVKAYEK